MKQMLCRDRAGGLRGGRWKVLLCILLVVLSCFSFPAVSAEETGDRSGEGLAGSIEEILSQLDVDALQAYLDTLTDEQRELFGDNIADKILSIVNGDFALDYADLLSAVFGLLFALLRVSRGRGAGVFVTPFRGRRRLCFGLAPYLHQPRFFFLQAAERPGGQAAIHFAVHAHAARQTVLAADAPYLFGVARGKVYHGSHGGYSNISSLP